MIRTSELCCHGTALRALVLLCSPFVASGSAVFGNSNDLNETQAAEVLVQAFERRVETPPWRCYVSITGFSISEGIKFNYHEAWDVSVDGRRLRALPLRTDPFQEPNRELRWMPRFISPGSLCVGCFSDSTVTYYTPRALIDPTSRSALSIYGEEAAEDDLHVVDPRMVGLIPRQLGAFTGLSKSEFYQWDPDFVSVEDETGKMDEVRIAVERVPGNRLTFVLGEARSFLPLAITQEYELDGKRERHAMEIEYEEHRGLWLPRVARYSHNVDDQQLSGETVLIETVSFGEPFPPNHFSLAALGIPPGTVVNWGTEQDPPGDPGTLRFDGEKVVALAPARPDGKRLRFSDLDSRKTARDKSWRMWLLGINAVVIAGAVLVLVRRLLKR